MEYVVEYTPDQIAVAIAICRAHNLVPKSSSILEGYTRHGARVDATIQSARSKTVFEQKINELVSITTDHVIRGANEKARLVVDVAFEYAFVDVIQRLYSIVMHKELADDVVRGIVRVLRTNVRESFVQRINSVFSALPEDVFRRNILPQVTSAVSTGETGAIISAIDSLSQTYGTGMKRGTEHGGPSGDGALEKRVKMTDPPPVSAETRRLASPFVPFSLDLSTRATEPLSERESDPVKILQIAAGLITSHIQCFAQDHVVIASAVALAHMVYDIDVGTYVGSTNFHGDIRFDKMAVVFVLLYSASAWKGIDKNDTYPIKCAQSDGYLRGRIAREFYCAYVAAMAAHDHIDVPVPYEHVEESEEERTARMNKAHELAAASDKVKNIKNPSSRWVDNEGFDEFDHLLHNDPAVAEGQHVREKANAMHILTAPTRAVSWCRKQLGRLEACIASTWQVYSPLSDLNPRFKRDLFASARAEAIRLTFSRFSSIVAARTSSVDREAMTQAKVFFGIADLYILAPGKAISDEIFFFAEILTRLNNTTSHRINPIIKHMMEHPRSTPGGILETVRRPTVQ